MPPDQLFSLDPSLERIAETDIDAAADLVSRTMDPDEGQFAKQTFQFHLLKLQTTHNNSTMQKTIVKQHSCPDIGRAVFAATHISREETVIRSRRRQILPERNKYTLEFNGQHILIDEPGVLVNHCCSPNCMIRSNREGAFDFIALQPISPGEEITFDYEMNESEISAFRQCRCGAADCRKYMNHPSIKRNSDAVSSA